MHQLFSLKDSFSCICSG